MQKKLFIWGASGHARVVADIIRLRGEYAIVGFLDDVNPDRHGDAFCGATILGGREHLDRLRGDGIRHAALGFGRVQGRLSIASLLRAQGFDLVTVIHPGAVIAADVSVGAGTVIKAGVVIDPAVTIGESATMGSGVTLGHDCVLAKGVRISGGSNLAGRIRVGSGTWIGTGVVIKDGITIGANTLIGAGAVVLNEIPDNVVAYGVPAKIIRDVTADDAW